MIEILLAEERNQACKKHTKHDLKMMSCMIEGKENQIHLPTYQPSAIWNANWFGKDELRPIEWISLGTISACAYIIIGVNDLDYKFFNVKKYRHVVKSRHCIANKSILLSILILLFTLWSSTKHNKVWKIYDIHRDMRFLNTSKHFHK